MRKIVPLLSLAAIPLFASSEVGSHLTLEEKARRIKDTLLERDITGIDTRSYDHRGFIDSYTIISYNPKTDVLFLQGFANGKNLGQLSDSGANGFGENDIYIAVFDGTLTQIGPNLYPTADERIPFTGSLANDVLKKAVLDEVRTDYESLLHLGYMSLFRD